MTRGSAHRFQEKFYFVYKELWQFRKFIMKLLSHLSEICKNAISIVTISWISILIVGRIYDFHVSYISFIEQIKVEKWLLEQCENDHFFHHMQYHTDVCSTVLSNSLIWPSLYAINYSMSNMKLCGFYDCTTLFGIVYNGGIPVIVCFFLFYVFTPSFLIPFLQGTYERYNHSMLVSRCSPIIKQSDKKHSMYYTTMNPYDERHKDA